MPSNRINKTPSGDYKATFIDYDEWLAFELPANQTPQTNMVCLSPQEIMLLQSAITHLSWRTRWLNLPDAVDLSPIISQLENKLMCNNGCCETVLYCIQNDPDIKQVIVDILNGAGWSNPSDELVAGTEENDLDCVWGGCIRLVAYIASEIEDILDLIDTAVDQIEAVLDYLSPKGWSVGYARGLEIFNGILAIGTAIVRFAMDTAKMDAWACDLFCIITAGETAPYTLTTAKMVEWIDSYQFSANPADIALNLVTRSSASLDLLELISRTEMVKRYQLGLDQCNDDWMTLCDPCVFCTLTDFAIDDGGYSLDVGFAGSYVTGQYWEVTGDPDTSSPGMRISKTIPAITATKITMSYAVKWGSLSVVDRGVAVRAYNNNVLVDEEVVINSGTTSGDVVLEIDPASQIDEIRLTVSAGASGSGAYARILSVEICQQ